MEYISAEEFLKQDKEIQCVFMEWWIPSYGDLFSWIQPRFDMVNIKMKNQKTMQVIDDDVMSSIDNHRWYETIPSTTLNSLTDYVIPLLTEGQLRKFIEDKTETKILSIKLNEFEVNGEILKRYCIHLDSFRIFMNQSEDLLQTYWKVALQIAKENKSC